MPVNKLRDTGTNKFRDTGDNIFSHVKGEIENSKTGRVLEICQDMLSVEKKKSKNCTSVPFTKYICSYFKIIGCCLKVA